MLSEAQQVRVWEGMLGAETRANYFAELSGRYMQRQRLATWATLLFSSGAVASLLANLPSGWKIALAMATTAVSLYSVVMQNQKLSVDASDLHARWNRLGNEYEKIWENVYADDAPAKLEALDDRAVDLSKSGTMFPNKREAMLRWQRYVVAQHLQPQA
jgi:hypothetical protein